MQIKSWMNVLLHTSRQWTMVAFVCHMSKPGHIWGSWVQKPGTWRLLSQGSGYGCMKIVVHCLFGYVILVIALCCAHAWCTHGLVKCSCRSVSHPVEPTLSVSNETPHLVTSWADPRVSSRLWEFCSVRGASWTKRHTCREKGTHLSQRCRGHYVWVAA